MNEPLWVQMVAVAAAAGALSPFVTALILQWHWPSWAKTIVGLLVSFGAAFSATAVVASPPRTVEEWSLFLVAVIGSTQVFYAALWKKAGIETLERNTTVLAKPGTHTGGK